MKVSVIVPVYNTERYLDRCMQSLLKQMLRDIEIILVDDCSQDGCPTMCDQYAKQNTCVKVLHKPVNDGLGLACNSGIDAANGDYIAFCDSDDWVDKEMYKVMFDAAKKYDADVVYSGILTTDGFGIVHPMSVPKSFQTLRSKEEILSYAMDMIAAEPSAVQERKNPMSAKIALYRRSLIEEHNLCFVSERQFISEDLIWNVDVLNHARCIVTIPKSFYFYFNNTVSLSKRLRLDRFQHFKTMREGLLEQTRKYNMPKETKIRIDRMFMGYSRFYIKQIVNSGLPSKEKKNIITSICTDEVWCQVWKSYPINKSPWKHRIVSFLMKHNSYLLIYFVCKYGK